MSVRSTTGCHSCKTVRKKCDEMKPECSRCSRSGIECKYEYIQPKDQSLKIRTKPGPRPKNELTRGGQLVPEGASEWTSTPRPTLTIPVPSTCSVDSCPLELPFPTSIRTPSGQYATDTVHFPSSIPIPLFGRLTTFTPTLLRQPSWTPTIQSSTPNEPSSYDTLLVPGETNCSLDLRNAPRVFNLSMDRDLGEESDLEGVKLILCVAPPLDPTVDSNSLAFVLQSYAQWISLNFFDPLKIVHKAKQVVTDQFALSSTSRFHILLISRLMNSLVKKCVLEEQGVRELSALRKSILGNIMGCNPQYLAPDEVRRRASSALDNTLELMAFLIVTSPLSSALNLFTATAPVFLAACPPPHPPHLPNIFLGSSINLKHFATADIMLSMITGRATFCRYHVPWSLDLCELLLEKQGSQGAEWLIGIPDQFIMLLAYMNGLRENARNEGSKCASNRGGRNAWDDFQYVPSNGISGEGEYDSEMVEAIDPRIIEKIGDDIPNIRILPCETKEPALRITRMAVRECWREVMFIYFYMAVCGANAQDPRVKYSLKKFMRLVNGIKPGRNPDMFLSFPMVVAGVATTKHKDRRTIISRYLGVPEYSITGTLGNDLIRMLGNVWSRTAMEGRPACWDDLSVACQSITGV
ncbi:unnamed protein product [Rhizoctonia solani]|uniref:Zn(2)-C6 fungal-type domain-containing protein n=1 Tax=Rhizoctonia solani TaxID=456999 RepID=A0A8H2XAK6_9AGAM|nr:unnamed protein product [Rhizoctonia solani]